MLRIVKSIFIFCYGRKKLFVLLSISIGIPFRIMTVYFIPFCIPQHRLIARREISPSSGCLKCFIYAIGHTFKMSALAIHHSAIIIGEFNSEVIVDFTIILSCSMSSTARPLNRNRIFSFYPIGYINIMHMLFHNMLTTKPVKIKPIAHLIFHFGLLWFAWSNPYPTTIPINLSRDHIADGTVLYTFDGFPIIRLVASL